MRAFRYSNDDEVTSAIGAIVAGIVQRQLALMQAGNDECHLSVLLWLINNTVGALAQVSITG